MPGEVAVTASPSAKGGQRARVVLVVDDEANLRELLSRSLRDGGYRALQATDGAEALELVESGSEPVDLVVTDVVMPGMDGRELGRRLAQIRPNLPVLYISAYEENDIFRRGSPSTSAPFLRKPFSQEILIQRVGELLSQPTGR
jgi:two-component system, cell cycle sensor histidine kinase and response regulator CckA